MTPEAAFAKRTTPSLAPIISPNSQSPSGVSATDSISRNGSSDTHR